MKTKQKERPLVEERWYSNQDRDAALRAMAIRKGFIETTTFWIREYTKQQTFAIQNGSQAEAEDCEARMKIERRHLKQAENGESIS